MRSESFPASLDLLFFAAEVVLLYFLRTFTFLIVNVLLDRIRGFKEMKNLLFVKSLLKLQSLSSYYHFLNHASLLSKQFLTTLKSSFKFQLFFFPLL
jgi:predicted membrane channel-forming protein YqfA (hemolysin III family)